MRRRDPKYIAIRRRKWTVDRAHELRDDLPRSEKWFLREVHKRGYSFDYESNIEFAGKIPDFISKRYKYIIEIDGSIHETENQISKDRQKDKIFEEKGYKVIRIIAYDLDSLEKGISEVFNRIKEVTESNKKLLEKKTKNKGKAKYKNKIKKQIYNTKRPCKLCRKREGTEKVFWKGRHFKYCQYCIRKLKLD